MECLIKVYEQFILEDLFKFSGAIFATFKEISTQCFQERKDFLPSPVCGSDCRTYSDFCNLQQTSCTDNADLKVLYNGQCADEIGQIKVQITGWPGPLVLLYYSGDVIELECKVEGSPVFQISWYKVFPYQSLTKPHSMLRNTNRTRIKIDNWSERVVRMNRALLDDSALYQCSVVSCFDEEVFSEPVEVFVMEKFQTLTASQAGKYLIRTFLCFVIVNFQYIWTFSLKF